MQNENMNDEIKMRTASISWIFMKNKTSQIHQTLIFHIQTNKLWFKFWKYLKLIDLTWLSETFSENKYLLVGRLQVKALWFLLIPKFLVNHNQNYQTFDIFYPKVWMIMLQQESNLLLLNYWAHWHLKVLFWHHIHLILKNNSNSTKSEFNFE